MHKLTRHMRQRMGGDGMRSDADVVVIGSGAFGASVAYHLAKRSQSVTIVDRFAPATQTSPRAAGQTQKVRYDPVTSHMAIRSVEMMLAFEADTGEPLAVRQVGALKFARTPGSAAQVRDEVMRGRALGIDIELVDRDEARRLAPYADPRRALEIWWSPTDVHLEPGDLPRGYVRAAARLGAEIAGGVTVTGVVTRDGSVERVVTDAGEIRTPTVVDAAGGWAPLIASMVGLRLPTVPVRHQLFITEPMDSVDASMPIVRVVDANVYVRPERGGLLVGGYEPDPVAVDPVTLSDGIDDLALDMAPLRRIVEDVAPEYPGLAEAPVAELRGGLPTMTPDGHHLFGEAPSMRGFWVMSGCVVAGLSISPAAGEAMADWMVEGDPGYDMTQFALDRFGPRFDDDDALRQACLDRYSHHYETPA
jgi:glycine/D-amino acid oxidase-like deaminating enzyme